MSRIAVPEYQKFDRTTPVSSTSSVKQRPNSPSDRKNPVKSATPATQARRDTEIVPDRNGMRFNSSIFTILAGETEHVFTAHETVLSQSPVLARFCQSQFREATAKEIALPAESVENIGRLLEYLYSGDYACGTSEKPFDEALELAGMYIIADKYNLEHLKVVTMDKLIAFKDFPNDKIDFFSLASLVYKHIPDSDGRFRAYFAVFAPVHITAMEEAEMKQLQEMMKVGGIFAQDAFRAQNTAWSKKMEGVKRAAEDELASAVDSKKAKPCGTPTSAKSVARKGRKTLGP